MVILITVTYLVVQLDNLTLLMAVMEHKDLVAAEVVLKMLLKVVMVALVKLYTDL